MFLDAEEAGAELAVGGEPEPVAVAAERFGDRRDDADLAASVGEGPATRGLGGIAGLVDRHEVEARAEPSEDLASGDDHLLLPGVPGIERHELDEAEAEVVFPRERRERFDLVVVEAADHDGVDLHRGEPDPPGLGDAGEDLGEPFASGHLLEVHRVQRIHAEADATEPGGAQRLGVPGEEEAVGRHREVADAGDGGELGEEFRDAVAEQRFAAGDADLLDAEAGGDAHEALDLLVGEQMLLRLPLVTDGRERDRLRIAERVELGAIETRGLLRLGQAVETAEIAAVGDADPKVLHHAAVGIAQPGGGHVGVNLSQPRRTANTELTACAGGRDGGGQGGAGWRGWAVTWRPARWWRPRPWRCRRCRPRR